MVRWMDDTALRTEIRALVVPSQARYLSVREDLHNIEFNKKYLVSLKPGWQRAQGTKPAISDFLNENEMNRALGHALLYTYRLNWTRRTSWEWWDEWDEIALHIQNPKFKPWRSVAEHATSRSWRLPPILSFTSGWGKNIFVSFKPPRPGNEPRTVA